MPVASTGFCRNIASVNVTFRVFVAATSSFSVTKKASMGMMVLKLASVER